MLSQVAGARSDLVKACAMLGTYTIHVFVQSRRCCTSRAPFNVCTHTDHDIFLTVEPLETVCNA